MKSKNKNSLNRRARHKASGWIAALVIVAVLGISGGIGWSFLAKEHNEAKSLPIDTLNFSSLKDGTYIGEYEGGMYKWRTNKVKVTVSSGKVIDITLISSAENTDIVQQLYDRVMKKQSLQVDAISGATLTSKAYLKAVNNALIQAGK
jgi:uncharacterized protein with FMN-binding domain